MKQSELNPLALEEAAKIALQQHYVELSWKLFENFSYLRPHFFWPLLLDAGRQDGESGILVTLQKMADLGVKGDMETLEDYCFPFCDLSDPE